MCCSGDLEELEKAEREDGWRLEEEQHQHLALNMRRKEKEEEEVLNSDE